MAGISAGAKEYLRVAFVMQGIPSSLIDEAVAKAPAGTNLSLGATPHDNAALDLVDTLLVSIGEASNGRAANTDLLNKARNYGTLEGAPPPAGPLYPPCTTQTATNFLKNV